MAYFKNKSFSLKHLFDLTEKSWNQVGLKAVSLTIQESTLITRPLGLFVPSHCF